jgi:hypothetical protein
MRCDRAAAARAAALSDPGRAPFTLLITPAGWLYQNVDGVAESWHKHGFWLRVKKMPHDFDVMKSSQSSFE